MPHACCVHAQVSGESWLYFKDAVGGIWKKMGVAFLIAKDPSMMCEHKYTALSFPKCCKKCSFNSYNMGVI